MTKSRQFHNFIIITIIFPCAHDYTRILVECRQQLIFCIPASPKRSNPGLKKPNNVRLPSRA